ncbi:cyclic nucleotide-binding domain-containing protein [Stappia sp. GBMRC 2046]|uniref:Cyclic nucleotide-binding domain-containing protein n=1 Tax=Stappia sediminis TaxID=2692190 RepID=A0A7X3LY85_9HYPH|nr:cation:proton antiporter [Stappia sediminis]MXN67295.1 cyclic nucleotide-binding domain-containing protein [Stappia sediminis]
MDIVGFTLSALTLILLTIAFATPVAEWLRLPQPVMIGGLGFAAGLASWWSGIDIGGQFLDSYDIWFVTSLSLDGQTLLLVFLPPLLYEMALGVNVRRLYEDWFVVIVMAVIAVLLATAFVGASLWIVSPLGLIACMLLGATISTTDPGAVITTFREIGAPRRLLVILEGESLLNDAAAIAIFGTLATLAQMKVEADAGTVLAGFVYDFAAGAGIGIALGWIGTRLYPVLRGSAAAEATATVALAYGSYLVTETVVGASGVVAVVFAGLTTTSAGIIRMGPGNWSTTLAIWNQIGFWASSLILLFAAALAPSLLLRLSWSDVLMVIVVYIAALGARAVVLFGLLPVLSAMGLGTPVTRPQKILILWGGVRGAVTLVLALTLADIGSIAEDERRVIAALAACYVLVTLLVNAASLRMVASRLGLDRLSQGDLALREKIIAGTVADVRDYVSRLAADRRVEPDAIEEMRAIYEKLVEEAAEQSQSAVIPFGERLRLGLAILANQELRLVQLAFEEEAIGSRVIRPLQSNGEKLADIARIEGREGYERAALAVFTSQYRFRVAVALQRYFRIDRPLRGMLAINLTILLETENILRELSRFVASALPEMIGDDAAANLEALVVKRLDHIRDQVATIARQYPNYTEEIERILLLRAATRREATQYRQLYEDGIVGAELYRELAKELAGRRRKLGALPSLDLGLSPGKLIDQVTLFASLSPKQRKSISRWLKSQFAVPGEAIVRYGERGNAMYFIASGVLEVRGLAQPVQLSNGDFFGELALLAPTRRRQTEIVAKSYCRLLTLSRRDFQRLTVKDPTILKAIVDAGERQLGEGFGKALPEEMDWAGKPQASSAEGEAPAGPRAPGKPPGEAGQASEG